MPEGLDELAKFLSENAEECKKYETCMSLDVSENGGAVELNLDTAIANYLDWIPGEGGDIGLLRCCDTNKVVGVRLPLLKQNLVVHHTGPLRINEGFLKEPTGE